MDKKRTPVMCAWINGPAESLDRPLIYEHFSDFGKVTKVFINAEKDFAKVYLDNREGLKQACSVLNGVNSWNVKLCEDNYNKNNRSVNSTSSIPFYQPPPNLSPSPSVANRDASSVASSKDLNAMEEEFYFSSGYVNIHGHPVDVLQGEDGKFFVSLEDAASCGFAIYPKSTYENTVIPKELEIQALENYLLDQGRKYIINFKKTFNEDEMISVLERVRERLQSKTESGFGQNRTFQNKPNKNLTITSRTDMPSTANNNFAKANINTERPPNRLPNNFQPTFSRHPNGSQKTDRHNDHGGPNERGQFQNRGPNNRNNEPRARNSANQQENAQLRKPRSFDNRPNNNMAKRQPAAAAKVDKEEECWGDEPASISTAPLPAKSGAQGASATHSPPSEAHSQRDDDSLSATQKQERLPSLQVNRVELNQGSSYNVKVSYVNADKPRIFHGQLSENENVLQDVLLDLNQISDDQPELKTPIRDTLCMALYDDVWYRAVVLHPKPSGAIFVELIDYGNKEEIETPLKELPEQWKTVPGQAIRFALDSSCQEVNLEIDSEVRVFVKKHVSSEYDDKTHVIEISDNSGAAASDQQPAGAAAAKVEPKNIAKSEPSPVAESEGCFTVIPPTHIKLEPPERVMIVNYLPNKLILRTRDNGALCRDIYKHIAEMVKHPISNPKVGQLVLCSKDSVEGLHRAIIKNISDKVAEVEYLDYHDSDSLALKSLRNINGTLASYPRATVELDYPSLAQMAEEGEAFLASLIQQKKKLASVHINGVTDLQIPDKDGQLVLLSQKISGKLDAPKAEEKIVEQAAPAPQASSTVLPKDISSPADQDKGPAKEYVGVKFDDMPYLTIPEGDNEYFCYSCTGFGVTILPISDSAIKHLEAIGVIEPTNDEPYDVEEYHMCLAKYDDVWYRAIVSEKKGDKREVLFVDYGNTEEVDKSEIRQLPERLKDVPIMGYNATFDGIPQNPKVHRRLQELVTENESYTITVTSSNPDEMSYMIKIPSVYETLRSEGLI